MYANILIAADSITILRKTDVYRVLDQDGIDREALGAWIIQQRPDLTDEVTESLNDINSDLQE